MRKNTLAILIIIIFAILLALPFIKQGFFTIHDDQQIARLFLFDQALFSGQIPPRWVNSLGFGFGYPLFIFYPPLVYALGEVFHLLGFGFISSIKLVFFSSIVLSGIAMYIFTKETYGKLAAVVSAVFYMLAPYRALDIYVRGALAEAFSFVWLPLILWSFIKLETTRNTFYIGISSTFLALLMITHNLVFLPFSIILAIFIFFQITTSNNKTNLVILYFSSVIFSLSLSAFFWLPSLMEKKFTLVDKILLTELADFKIHYVYPIQLWNWPWGFGGSAQGLLDGLSFKIGKIHILTSIAAVLITLTSIIKNKKKLNKSNYKIIVPAFILLFSAFMTTFYSEFIWNFIPQLAYLQFPWRFLIFTTLFSSYLTAAFIYQLKLPIIKLITSMVIIIIVFVPNFKLFKPQFYRSFLDDQKATNEQEINWYVSSSSFEYLPKDVDLKKTQLGTSFPDVIESDIPKNKVENIKGSAKINIEESLPGKLTFTTNSSEVAELKINIFNFPGWEVKIDNSKTQIYDNNKLKLINIIVPSGQHIIKVTFKNTTIVNFANLLSTASVLVLGVIFLNQKLKKS